MDIPGIIAAAGGKDAIARRRDLSVDAVKKWPIIGIPDRHWSALIEMSGGAFGPEDLYEANRAARAAAAATKPGSRAEPAPARRKTAAVVLAAGKGRRMESELAKVMHPLAGRPMIQHVLAGLEALEADRVVVVIGPEAPEVAAAVAPVPTVIQATQRGTAHAVEAARAALGSFAGDGDQGDVLVLYGDTPLIRPETLEMLLETRRAPPYPAVVVLGFPAQDPGEYGRLIVGPDGTLEAIVEASDAGLAEEAAFLCNSGVVVADGAHLFELVDEVGNDNPKAEYRLTDIVAIARRKGLACAYVKADPDELIGTNSRAELARAEAILQQRLRAQAMRDGATLIDPGTVYFSHDTRLGRDVVVGPCVFFGPGVTVGDDVEIRPCCHIEGASIAAGAVIGPFARLRPGAVIGPGAHIGNFVEVKKARIEAGAKVNHLSYIGDARVGADANIGAGTITCNYDGFRKSKTDIGARAFIGSNTALVAPVKVGDGAVVGAGSVITRDVAADALALGRAGQREVRGWAVKYRAQRRGRKAARAAAKPPAGRSGKQTRRKG